MEKSWITAPITSNIFKSGVEYFINFARVRAIRGSIVCPCGRCCNCKWLAIDSVHTHILRYGFLSGYTIWTFHGEHVIPSTQSQSSIGHETIFGQDDTRGLIRDALGVNSVPLNNEKVRDSTFEGDFVESFDHNEEDISYKRLLEECDKELYPGCKYSNLSFTLHLYHVKCIGGISNKAFSMLLELLRDAFPHLTSLPSSANEAKKLTKDLGLGYEKIHACPNDCMLYWGDRIDQQSCHVCKAPRYKSDIADGSSKSSKPNKPSKVLRYFPLIPRLTRLYMSKITAKEMRWHDIGRTKDGKLRHPADGFSWKEFDVRYPEFASDPRSVRLGLASDGFNPFRTLSTTYSTWPVLLIPYNLPPWICMKQQSFILSAIIPGEKGPGNDIDVYLEPLIQELKLLWEGVDAYDAYSKQKFKLRASLLWTVNDFPAYANLSGWSTKGRVACPICTKSTRSDWLTHGKKFCYMGHRRWLEKDHHYRFQQQQFDGTIETEGPPDVLTGSEVLKQLRGTRFMYGKSVKSYKRKRDDVGCSTNDDLITTHDDLSTFELTETFIQEDIDGENQLWKKKSIFFDLPYWEYNLLRHNLDVMHIEKNVCDNLLSTLLNMDGKTKDNENTRKDLMEWGIRHDLHLINRPNKKPHLPPACYTMSSVEKSNFLQVLKNLKVPDGYASNISRGVSLKDHKVSNLKSHDGHILMQDILPIALRISMLSRQQSRVVKVVSDFCSFFKGLCAKVLDISELEKMEYQIIQTLCELERVFPPSFFTIMVHLTIHLISEAKLGGPVHFRWMYPVERYLMRLKSYVRNKAQPEGSIAEGYIKTECLTFCSRYFEGVETVFNRPPRNDEHVPRKEMYMLNSGGRKLGKVEIIELGSKSLSEAHRYVLLNHSKIQFFRDRFLAEQQALRNERMDSKTIEKLLVKEFSWWLKCQVPLLEKNKVDEEVLSLAIGPSITAKQYKGFITNGFRFHTTKREESKKTQNSGVIVEVEGGNYYGKLTNIIELEYFNGYKVVLFQCDWVDVRPSKGLKKDKYGFTLVNFSRPLVHTGEKLEDDPYIISSQAKQVFYIKDLKDVGWSHVIMTKPRDTYDMGTNVNGDDDDLYTQCIPYNLPMLDDVNEAPGWHRMDTEYNMTNNYVGGAEGFLSGSGKMLKSNTTMQQHPKKRLREPATSFYPEQFHLHHNPHPPSSSGLHQNSLPPHQFHDNSHPLLSRQLHDNSHPPSSNQSHHNSLPPSFFFQTPIRPPFLSNIRQNSSSSSSSTHSESQTTSYKPLFHQSSSTSPSLSNHEEEVDENELKLLFEAEIIDADGKILRQEKLRAKDVFKLREGEKILVHVNEYDQPIKGAAGLCTRFMTLLLKEPNLCPPEAKNWSQCKRSCGIRLLLELRRRFSLPQKDNVDKVLLDTFDEKFRSLKSRLKKKLLKRAAKILDEGGVLVGPYTEDQLLGALDLVAAPHNFLDHQWETFKNNLRSPTAKKLSQYGKKARASKLHNHTTGAVSFARRKDEFKTINNREANDFEFFGGSHLMKSGSYATYASRELVELAREEISKKILEVDVSEPIDAEKQSEVEREVMRELRRSGKHGRPTGFGVGVRKSQVTKFSFDLRKIRGETSTNENRYLLDKVVTQSKQIESQSKQIESQRKQIETQCKQMSIMEQKIDECTAEIRLFRTAFPDIYGARISSTPQPSASALYHHHS